MRKLLVLSLSIAAAALLALAGPAPAPAATPKPGKLRVHALRAKPAWLQVAGPGTLAYGGWGRGAGIATLGDDGAVRSVTAPAGCGGTTAGGGHLHFACGDPADPTGGAKTYQSLVTDLAGREQARVTYAVPAFGGEFLDSPYKMGEQWLLTSGSCYHCGVEFVEVNWHTGEVRTTFGYDLGLHMDLDAPALTVPLCAPLRSVKPPELWENVPQVWPVEVRGRWAIVGTVATGPEPYDAWIVPRLRRCGSAKPVDLGANVTPIALGDGWVATRTAVAHRTPRIDVVRLRDRRRFTLVGVPGDIARDGIPKLTAGRVAFGDGRTPLLTARLPK